MASGSDASGETEMQIDQTDDAESGQTSPKRRREDEGEITTSTVSATSTPDTAEVAGTSHADAEKAGNKNRFVLRQLNIKNFVKFKEEQELVFDSDGAYFLIGSNQTEKSSIFEAIRRCMSINYQSSVSSADNEKEDSIVVCKFKNTTETMFSYYIREANTDDKVNQKDKCIILKGCIILDNNDGVKEFGMDRVKYGAGEFVSHKLKLSPPFDQEFLKPGYFSLDAFLKWVREMSRGNQYDNGESTCEAMLKENLKYIVFTFPMRGIGPLQWSNSSHIRKQTENYTNASERAEVIMWYLDNYNNKEYTTDDKKKEQELCKKKEQEFYDFITNTNDVVYELESAPNDKHKIIVKPSSESTHSILKQSEGFIEAKICSILLAVSDFATVLLEDPDTGMHPQMVDRLCTTMAEKVQNKVVIVTTHNAGFLKPWLLENIFYFSNDKGKGCKVTSGKVFTDNTDLKDAIPGSFTLDQFGNFCTSETILFVEGVSDQAFIEALARYLRSADSKNHMLFSSFQCVSLGGEGNKMHFRKCCKILNKRYAFVLDGAVNVDKLNRKIKDDIVDEEKEKLRKTLGKAKLGNRDKKEVAKIKANIDFLKLDKSELENHFFLWDFKDLEDVFFHGLEGNTGNGKKQSGVLKEIRDKKVPLPPEMQEILKRCFPTIRFGFKDNLISTISKTPEGFKLFLDGKERFEDSVQLIEFLLKNAEASIMESVEDIHKLNNFLLSLDKIGTFHGR